MSSAHLTSIDVLARFRVAMQTFRDEANAALGMAQMVVQRYTDWIEHDRVAFWELQIRRGWEKIAEARADLERCESLAMEGQRKTCHEEKEALDAAKRRLRRAEEQLEAVRHWRNKLQHEIAEYRARTGQLGGWLEADHPKAMAALERMHAALAAYVALQAPTDGTAASGPSMARDETASVETAREEATSEEAETAPPAEANEEEGPA